MHLWHFELEANKRGSGEGNTSEGSDRVVMERQDGIGKRRALTLLEEEVWRKGLGKTERGVALI